MKKTILWLLTLQLITIISWGAKFQNYKPDWDITFSIISEKEHVDQKFGYNKCNILVELRSKQTKETLKVIADSLRSTRKKYKELWISYYLSSTSNKEVIWAMTNFKPNLEIEILGASDAKMAMTNNILVDGKIIGRWKDERPMVEHGIVIYQRASKVYMKCAYIDNSVTDEECIMKKVNGKIRFDSKQTTHGEYYLIEFNGNLGLYGKNGKFSEAIKNP